MKPPKEDGIIRHPLPTAIQRATYLPAPLHIIANVMTWGASRVYRHHFDVGANEWRILGALSVRAGITASEACEILGIKKAIASMSIKTLRQKGLIVTEITEGAKLIYLTKVGAEIHDAIVPIARKREEILLAGLEPEEATQLLALAAKLERQLPQLQAYDDAMVAKASGDDGPGTADEEAE